MSDSLQAVAQEMELAAQNEVMAPLPQETQDELVKKLKYEYDTFKSAVAPLHQKLDKWSKVYEAVKKGSKTWPWPGASNYVVPLAMATIDSIHARIMKSVFEVDPIWLASARTPEASEATKKAEWYLDYWADTMRLRQVIDSVALNMLIDGVGILKTDWARDTRPIPTTMTPDGQPTPSQVVEYDGPRGYAVPLKDFVLIPADAPTIDDAVYVGHRVFLTRGKLQQRRDRGLYFNVNRLLEKSDSPAVQRPRHPSGLLATTDGGGQYPETDQYEIVELYGPYEFTPGNPQPALFTLSVEHSILLRIEPYPYKYGRSPYTDFSIFPRSNFFWARSMAEMLESPQEELTALHNMRGDSIARRIAPPLLRRMGSRWDPETQPWKPGQVIDVNDPAEISELQLSEVPSSLFAHEQDIMAFTERMTGMSDVFMGRVSSPYQTATATTAARTEGLVRMDISISRFQESMQRLAWVLWWLLFQYRPYMDTLYADNQAYTIYKTEMVPQANGLMPFEFHPQGMLSDASKEARRQQHIFLLNTLANPLSQFYPDGIQKMLEQILNDFDFKNVAEVLGPPWSVIQQQIQMAAQQGFAEGQKAAQQQKG